MSVRDSVVDAVGVWADDHAWRRKIASDADQIKASLPAQLRGLHTVVIERARAAAAKTLILSGSTVRLRRTDISDLDYHLVGEPIDTKNLSRELDLHVLSAKKLESEVLNGDDFVQWSLRFGCIVFDDGTARRALSLIAEYRPWPDIDRKRAHAAKSLELAKRLVASGDSDGALLQVRTALSLAARARLLSAGVFPLSRAELPAQLEAIGCLEAAHDLAATIYAAPALTELADGVRHGEELVTAISDLTCVQEVRR